MEESKESDITAEEPTIEDVRCGLITIIRSFFEKEDEFKTLDEYLEAIKNLSNDTDKFISECIEAVFSITPGGELETDEESTEEIKTSEVDESIKIEDIQLESTQEEATTDLMNLKSQLIMNELEFTHNKKYKEIIDIIKGIIDLQIEKYKREKEEFLFFLSPDDPQIYSIQEDLVKDHQIRFKKSIELYHPEFPEIIANYTYSLFEEQFSLITNEIKKTINNEKDVQEMIDEWTLLIDNILSSILKVDNKDNEKPEDKDIKSKFCFWDKNVLENSSEFVLNFTTLVLLLYAQNIKSDKEINELQGCFDGISHWIINNMEWAKLSQSDLDDIYASYCKARSDNSGSSINKSLNKIKQDIQNESGSYKLKFVTIHFALFLTSTIDKFGKISVSHYNPGHRQFLYCFLNSIYDHERSKKLLQIFEKCFGELLINGQGFAYQDPINSPLTEEFKIKEVKNTVSYIEFVNKMKENKEEFEKYISNTNHQGIYGTLGDDRVVKKEALVEYRTKILNNSTSILENNKDLKAQFELISPKCELGRHSVITVSGFLSEKDDNTEAWIGLCNNNSTLPVYSYCWASKGVWSMAKPFIPTSIKSLSNKLWILKLSINIRYT